MADVKSVRRHFLRIKPKNRNATKLQFISSSCEAFAQITNEFLNIVLVRALEIERVRWESENGALGGDDYFALSIESVNEALGTLGMNALIPPEAESP